MASQTALSIYVDHLVGARNQQLRLENDSLEAVRNLLGKVRVLRGTPLGAECVEEFNLLQGNDDEEFVSFDFASPFEMPTHDAGCLHLVISGVLRPTPVGLVAGNSLSDPPQVELHFSDMTTVVGSLQNSPVSLPDMQEAIQYLQRAREAIFDSGAVPGDFRLDDISRFQLVMRRAVEGSTILVGSIKFAKDAFKKILSVLDDESQVVELDEGGLWELQALKNLAQISLDHDKGLAALVEERLALERCNKILQSSRSLLETMEVQYQYEEAWTSLRFKLEDGSPETNLRGKPAWSLTANEAIPLASFSSIQFLLGGIVHQSDVEAITVIDPNRGLFGMKLHPFIWAVFSLDVSQVEGGDRFNFARGLLISVMNAREGSTLTLRKLQIDKDAIMDILDVLEVVHSTT